MTKIVQFKIQSYKTFLYKPNGSMDISRHYTSTHLLHFSSNPKNNILSIDFLLKRVSKAPLKSAKINNVKFLLKYLKKNNAEKLRQIIET